MNCLCNAADILPPKPTPLHFPFVHTPKNLHPFTVRFNMPIAPRKTHNLIASLSPSPSLRPLPSNPNKGKSWQIEAMPADNLDVDMVRNSDGVWTARQKKVVVLWDLDNKPPRGPPYEAAMALRDIAQRFGDVVDISAYANRHAFIHLPQWVLEERRDRHRMDILERKGLSVPSEPYVCGVCGRKCRTNLDLKKHFKQLHERERQKKLSRMRSLKGKKRQRYKERFVSGNHKYQEAARELIKPRVGYGLASELRRAGVFVKTVEDKPQAADWALKRQMQHSMSRGIDWLFLVSDDSDFSDMLRRARESDLRTVVIGDGRRALSHHADIWVPWIGVETGEVGEEDLRPQRRDGQSEREEDGFFSLTHFEGEDDDEESDADCVVDEILVRNSGFGSIRISAFSEEEWDGEEFDDRSLSSSFMDMDLHCYSEGDEREEGYY
ncbi:uncharacterized protein LOC131232724 [Magnolia sinica]|uniref:uncharacterized protein LOC131232724 n=1 Tax=Magnolia sinica TaxID=86752 RepID=UPI00265987AF|nr:uncharacterized protein LOC131232724 [Magnolia sinica]XP_058085151.1 uncharacterized protein LOC131232724 [Magnolia sinica]